MGPDLTGTSKRMSEKALVSACEHTPYKVMKTAYEEHSLVHQEALDLAAYLTSLKDQHKMRNEPPVVLLAIALAGMIFAIIAFGYRNRNTSARAKLVRRD